MLREFEIFTKPSFPAIAVKRGFSWPGFLFSWIWAFAKGLWLPGGILFFLFCAFVALGFAEGLIFNGYHLLTWAVWLAFRWTIGVRGNSWRVRKLEREGYEFAGTVVEASSPAAALTAHSLGKKHAAGIRRLDGILVVPRFAQQLLAITGLTWKAALRFRLFLAVAVLLLAAVIGLPILVKDDGTARGFTQILLTYTLGSITALLGISTLWLSCGTLARDIEECQMQVVATKPIARWQIWLGKWLGIITLNAALLAISGACVFGLLHWRASKLPAAEQATLHNEVLVARGSAKPDDVTAEIEQTAQKALDERLKQPPPVSQDDLPLLKKQIEEQVKAEYQVVPPGYTRTWEIKLGSKAKSLRDQPLQVRIKFNSAQKSPSGTFVALWRVGGTDKVKNYWESDPMSLAPDTYHEFAIQPNMFDEDGTLTISFANPNESALLFPIEDGVEVLYPSGSFAMNFVRGLGIIFCWMALLAAIGLASASFLSFPVAAFLSLAILVMALSSGTMANVVQEGSIDSSAQTDKTAVSVLNVFIVPTFRVALRIIDLAQKFSPVDSLSSGRCITWGELGMAFVQIVLLLGGIFAFFGIFVFNRRELATAQNQA